MQERRTYDNRREGPLGDFVTARQTGSSAKELVTGIGKDDDFLTLTDLVDTNEAAAIATMLHKCDKYNLTERKKHIVYLLRARCSIKGSRALAFLEASTGIVVPSFHGFKEDGNKRFKRDSSTESKPE